jgi:hypothetical protein
MSGPIDYHLDPPPKDKFLRSRLRTNYWAGFISGFFVAVLVMSLFAGR